MYKDQISVFCTLNPYYTLNNEYNKTDYQARQEFVF